MYPNTSEYSGQPQHLGTYSKPFASVKITEMSTCTSMHIFVVEGKLPEKIHTERTLAVPSFCEATANHCSSTNPTMKNMLTNMDTAVTGTLPQVHHKW